MSEDGHNKRAIDAERIDIEGIVREVLSRLSAPEVATSSAGNRGANNGKQLVIQQRVVTLAELDGQLTGASQVVVPRGAVVTPAVKDLLRQTGVALTFAASGAKTGGATNKHRLTIAVVESSYEPAALLRAMEAEFESVQRIAKTALDTVIDEMAAQVSRGGDLGLLLTGRTAAASCLANRQRGVRAVVAQKTSDVARGISDVGVNLLVIDPATKGLFELKQMVKTFAMPGTRQCPADLRERLG